jgi:hypothetical protein
LLQTAASLLGTTRTTGLRAGILVILGLVKTFLYMAQIAVEWFKQGVLSSFGIVLK